MRYLLTHAAEDWPMSVYKLPRIAELAHQLRMSPARLRLQQLQAGDHLLTLVDPEQYYPYSWVCWHITGYRAPVGAVDPANLRGAALLHDLLLLCQEITRQNPIPQTALPWPVWTVAELAERMGVSTKTISRWREEGLPAWYTLRPDGQIRLTVPENGLRRFTVAHLDAIRRCRRFSQLTSKQREQVLERARQLRDSGCASMNRVCRLIAAETGRSAETIRYTLIRFDPHSTGFPAATGKPPSDGHKVLFECWKNGDAMESLAQRFEKPVKTVRRIVLSQQRRVLLTRKVAFLYSAEFDLPDAEARILGGAGPTPPGLAEPASKGTAKLPDAPPQFMIATGTLDPMTSQEETATFRQYNYCKFRLAALLQELRKTPKGGLVEQAMVWTRRVEALRSRLVETNLRLVVSVAKRHLRYGAGLEEMCSEGNVILLRAVEKFDYTRGYKFSTYATWSIVRHYARLIPLWEKSLCRQQTGCDEFLKTAGKEEPVSTDLEQQILGGLLQNLLDALPKRERKVIQWHYGLPQGTPVRSLTQIATRLGISKERVRQIETDGLTRLKALLEARRFQYL
jgi:RNA polymerase primary sigma factor